MIELVRVVVTFIGLTIVSNKFVIVSQRSQLARSTYFPATKTRIHSEEVNSYMPLLCGWDKALQYCNDSDDQAALQNHFHVYPFVMRNWAVRYCVHALAYCWVLTGDEGDNISHSTGESWLPSSLEHCSPVFCGHYIFFKRYVHVTSW